MTQEILLSSFNSLDPGLPQYQATQLGSQRPGYMAQLPQNPLEMVNFYVESLEENFNANS